MALPVPLALCVGGVFCCSLLALHLLWLATLHRRGRPTVLSGHADFAATLVGLTGFLAVVGPAVAAAGRAAPTYRRPGSLDAVRDQLALSLAAGPALTALVAAGLVTAVAIAAWRRRDTLEVHNIDPSAVGPAVAAADGAVGAVTCEVRPAAAHATVRVRRLDSAATRELLADLRRRLAAAPPPPRPGDGRYTLMAAALLGVTAACFLGFFKLTRMI